VLTGDPDELARTDIADHALKELRKSAVREVVIAARRGPAHSAFTLPELIGLTGARDVVLDPEDQHWVRADLATVSDSLTRHKLDVLSSLDEGSAPASRPRIRLAYGLTPRRILGEQRAAGVDFSVAATGERRRLDAGVVLTSIGYRGKPIRDLPFDDRAAVVPNEGGRVVDPATGRPVPGAYVAGWIKRGPTGFIGTNKSCSFQTVQALVADFNSGALTDPAAGTTALAELVAERQPDAVDSAGWRAIDAAEVARGSADGRPRRKFTNIADMLAAAAAAPQEPPRGRRLLARLRASL
jgi:ferredoxin--NADP+ reductase